MQKAHDPSKNSKWVDYPDIESPIIADELNRHETELDEIDSRVVVHETTKANQVDLLTCVASITLNTTTGILTITLKNGSSTTIDTGLSKLTVNFDYDADPTSPHYEQLILEMADGTYKYIDLSALITQFEFVNSATITWTVGNDGTVTANIINGSITEAMLETNFLANCRLEVSKALGFSQDAEAWAKGTKGGTPVASTDEHYHNNSKYYSEVAHTEADNATTKAQDSEAWAVGKRNGQDVPSTDETYHNNAKYWAEQAEGAVTGNDKVTWEANGVLGAKNLIPYPYYESDHTESGITWTVNSDGSITANGTATANSTFILRNRTEQTKFVEKNTSYILSGCPSGGSNSKYSLSFFVKNQDDSNIASGVDFGNGKIINMPNQDYYGIYAIVRVFSGQTVSNLTFYPMLRLAEDTDNTYQPYAKTNKQLTNELKGKVDWVTNGKLGVKNLIPYPYYHTTRTANGITWTVNDDGTVTANGTATARAEFVIHSRTLESFKLPVGEYLLSGCALNGSASTWAMATYYTTPSNTGANLAFDYGLTGDRPLNITDAMMSQYFTIGISLVIVSGVTVENLVFKPMIRLAEDTDSTYQPYARTNNQLTDDVKDVWKANGRLGAKNLVPYPFFNPNPTYTNNGVTFTDNGDGTITANGTASSSENASCHFIARRGSNYKLPLGKYILTGCPEGGSSTTYRIGVNRTVNGSPSTYGNDYGMGFIFEVTDDTATIGCFIDIIKGATVNNVVFKPMIRLAEDVDGTFQPYAKTNQQLTKDSPFKFGVDGNGNYGYIKAGADTVTPFRNPKGNAVVANVLSGKTFANASSDELTGTMANYSGSNRQTITVSAGTGTQQISLSAGYHDSVIVDRTNAYNAGANAIRNTEWSYPVSAYQQKDSRDTERSTLYYRAFALGVKNNHGTKIVKDAVYGNANDMYAIGVFTEMFGWESGSGSHVIQNLSDITTWTYDGDTYPAVLVTGKDLISTRGVGQIVTWAYGTAYLSLYRKGIQ